MPGFRRIYNSFPGYNTLGNIESVNVIDIVPPEIPLGAGTIVASIIGEFEDGPFETPTQIFSGSDLQTTFGGFGFTKSGAPNQYPVAQQSAGSATPWEGNGFISLRGKKYGGLIVTRVDGSAGSVQFTRLACLTGIAGPYAMADAQTLSFSVDGAAAVTATLSASRAVKAGLGFAADAATQVWSFDDSGTSYTDETTNYNDATDANWLVLPTGTAAIDDAAYVGFTRPVSKLVLDNANGTAGVGGSGVWEYWDGTAWTALAGVTDGTSGFTVAVADGQEVSWTVPTDWAATLVNAVSAYYVRFRATVAYTTSPVYDQGFIESATAVTGFAGGETLELKIDGGTTRVVSFPASAQTVAQAIAEVNSQTATDTAVLNGTNMDLRSTISGTGGSVEVVGGTGALRLGHLAGTAMGSGNVVNVGQVQTSEVVTLLSALTGITADITADNKIRACNTATPGTGTLEFLAASTGDIGMTDSVVVNAGTQADVTVPAGTLLKDTVTDTLWMVMRSQTVTGGAVHNLKVRPAVDTDTAPTAAIGSISQLVDAIDGAFLVNNSAAISRLTDAQMDVRYSQALDATIGVNGLPNDIDVQFSARSTGNILRFGRDNALAATASGHKARKFVFSPPIGTSRTTAKASTGVGVGAARSERVFYAFPGGTQYIPEIAAQGTTGGVGFTADGVIDAKADAVYAAVRSILPPEENAGQDLSDTNVGPLPVLSMETAYDPENGGTGLTIDDYIDFKANGIIALRSDRGAGMVFQSDVTSVDPSTNAVLADAKRRFMGDFVINSFLDIASKYSKKLSTPARRRALLVSLENFLVLLQSPEDPEASRIDSYSVVNDTTPNLRALGFETISSQVKLYSSMDAIVIRTEVGTTVTITEA